MDARRARDSLNEIKARQTQVAETVAEKGSPWWYVAGLAAVLLAVSAGMDLTERAMGWVGDVADYAILLAGLAVIWWLAVALNRSIGVRVHRYPTRVRTYLVGLTLAILVVYIGVGMGLRLYDVAWDSTISGAAAALVFIGGSVAMRRISPAGSPAASRPAE